MTKLSDIIKGFVKTGEESTGEVSKVTRVSDGDVVQSEPRVESQKGEDKRVRSYQIEDSSGVEASLVATEGEIEVTDEYREAFSIIEGESLFIFITGRAGTGKSTFVDLLKERLKSYAIVAPTGVAALNVGGQTIHSFFKFRPGPIDLEKIGPVRSKEAYKALKALIIDEVSMVRADLLDAIDRFLRINGLDRTLPFGGVKIIAVGDLFQLPPVVSTDEEQAFIEHGYESPYFFAAKSLQSIDIKKIEFSKVFRQKEGEFISLLNSVREGRDLEEVVGKLNERVTEVNKRDFDGMILTATNKVANDINIRRLMELDGRERVFEGAISGEIRVHKDKLPAPMELILKIGAQVMFLKNNGKVWVNGTVGEVVGFLHDGVEVKIKKPHGDVIEEVKAVEWENYKFSYSYERGVVESEKVGSYKQIPLMLAWAVTIHKSQGKTFDQAHIDLGWGAFSEGQVYVALSRCRTFEGITLEKPLKISDVKVSSEVLGFG